jgi:hypothetical protein
MTEKPRIQVSAAAGTVLTRREAACARLLEALDAYVAEIVQAELAREPEPQLAGQPLPRASSSSDELDGVLRTMDAA